MRSVWNGSTTFGLVSIPVAVYSATKEEKVSFKQLRKKDLSPVRYKKVAEADETERENADTRLCPQCLASGTTSATADYKGSPARG